MNTTDVRSDRASGAPSVTNIDMNVEVIVVPVSDVDRAKEFYGSLGWRLDVPPSGVVQFMPHGYGCSVQFDASLTSAAPGSGMGYLIVSDIEAARDALVQAGIVVSEISTSARTARSAVRIPSIAAISPVPRATRMAASGCYSRSRPGFPGGSIAVTTSFGSASDVAGGFRRGAATHGGHEKRMGEADANWPDWYAKYLVAEQAGTELQA